MNNPVYIVICYIPAFDKSDTRVKIFRTKQEAQAFKTQQENLGYIVLCDIYEAHKIMS